MKFFFFVLLALFSTGVSKICQAQSYGLGFDSYEVIQDKRTGLDLSPDQQFCFDKNFELSFDLSFLPDKKVYFGYVVRLIENDKQNIDIIFDNSVLTNNFKLVIGDKFSPIAFDFPHSDIFKKWNKISVKFLKSENMLVLTAAGKTFRQPMQLADDGCFKILFGTNQYKDFKSTDIPPMKIRNIALSENGSLKYFWPLNESDGLKASEDIRKKDALVTNPVWIKKLHHTWQPLRSFNTHGFVKVAFDEPRGFLYVLTKDSLINFDIGKNRSSTVLFETQKQPIYIDNQAVFDPVHDKLYNLYVDERSVSTFDLKNQQWDTTEVTHADKTNFQHANKFYSFIDSSIYILGGYGHLAYKNTLQRYNVSAKIWETIALKDSLFTPRYLAGLGATKTGAYLIGGYGSATGQQMLNPRNRYDLLFFDSKTRKFKKIYELKVPDQDFVFANSIIVNEKDSTFFALIFPKNKFNSELQLIKGSLTRPEFQVVGSKIPFQFIDTHSAADLFFDHTTGQFVAVTLFRTDSENKVSVYTLNSPPLASVDENAVHEGNNSLTWWLVGLVVLAILSVAGYVFYRRKRQIQYETVLPSAVEPTILSQTAPPVMHEELSEAEADITQPPHDVIFLFGNLQLFDEDGNEITKQFSPLVKELFLVILLYSIRWEGISSEKLKELLWFDKPAESARNNRSVNIAKLKGILDKMKHCQVSKETGYWKVKVDYDKIRIDYMQYQRIIAAKNRIGKEDIIQLAEITKRGNFLADLEYEWLDTFKSEISNEVIDTYLRFAGSIKIADDPEFLVKLASYIFYFDPVNEEAMIIKCKALAHLGKHSLAKTTLENFAREYNRIYGEEFGKDMTEILQS